jgi:purine-binding chemotaxis protein CheW
MDDFGRLTNEHLAGALDGTRYLTFRVAREQYGIAMLAVREITCLTPIAPLPGMPRSLRGLARLGTVAVPVIDPRAAWAMGDGSPDPFSVIIVMNARDTVMGLSVDAVSDVLTIPTVHTPATPDIAWAVDARYIGGIGKAGDTLVRVLDVERLLGAVDDITAVPA